MDRSNRDPFWNRVVEMNDGSLQCKFCLHPFAKDTSISRIKWHLSGERRHGVAICDRVPKQIQEAAFLAMCGGNKKQKTIATSSRPLEEYNEVESLAREVGRIQMAGQGTEQGLQEGTTSSRAEAGNHVENMAGETMQIDTSITAEGLIADAPDLVGQATGMSWPEIYESLMKDDIENGTGGVAQLGAGPSSSGGITRSTNEFKRDAVLTTKLVGQAFKENKEKICTSLKNDEVSSIGIYGMGGVGKTTLMTHVHNKLLDTSCHVYWVTVSQDFSIERLQNSIARCIGLDLSSEEEELYRAAKLSKELMKKQKCVLILDDLWNHFELHKVGIPIQVKGCKVILTTRSERVCQVMECQTKIKVEPLSREEAWTSFVEKLGHDTALPPEVERIAKSVARECAGLPLGITTMAATMRGVVDIHEWRFVLGELEESKVRQDDMEPEVFRILRYSYTHLKDSSLQQCLLYCSLFPEDFEVSKSDLIEYLIDEGIIKGMKSRQAEFDKGQAMLNKLQNVCLLERGRYADKFVRMHDLIRDMSLQIQQENSPVMVKAGAELRELPDAKEWTENLVRVSLMENQIQEIPSSHSPRCPNLSTLLLSLNYNLQFIADSFFKEMHGLKVLDLSDTGIEKLPDSVSDLTSLNALLLRRCRGLRHVPSLQELTTLERLDLSYSAALEKMPQGMECLSNLTYLALDDCWVEEFPSGILPKLLKLQVLIMNVRASVTVEVKEVACLRKLEILSCHFKGQSDFVEYLKYQDETKSLSRYNILVGQLPDDYNYDYYSEWLDLGKTVRLCDLRIKSLWDVSSLIKFATELEGIMILDCSSMESLVSPSWFCSAPLPSPSYNGIFSSLKKFVCCKCRSMKKLFPPVVLPNLVNLEDLGVESCEAMEDIIARRDEAGVMDEEFSLPKLMHLILEDLPELKSICSAKLICDSLQVIVVGECRKLKRMPICFSLLDNDNEPPSVPPSLQRINIEPKEWWETVEWEQANAKDVLRPFVQFIDPTKGYYVALDAI